MRGFGAALRAVRAVNGEIMRSAMVWLSALAIAGLAVAVAAEAVPPKRQTERLFNGSRR